MRNRSIVDFILDRGNLITVIFKIVQLLMACAIFNPFCCCTAGVLSVSDATEMPSAHSCCELESSDLPIEDNSNQSHELAECPHAALKDYEIANHQDLTATNHIGTLLPAQFVMYDLLLVESSVQAFLPVSETTLSTAPPRSFAQVYCVYRV
jgi:hypothetical protein